jgi:hypothetical protein
MPAKLRVSLQVISKKTGGQCIALAAALSLGFLESTSILLDFKTFHGQ